MFEQLLLLICEDAAKQKQDGVGISWKVRRIIDINYPSPINLSMLSSILVYSPSYIDRSFRKIFGMSVNQYLIQTRLNAANPCFGPPTIKSEISRKALDIMTTLTLPNSFGSSSA